MFDLETLGVNTNAMILTIAAVVFDPLTGEIGEIFYSKVDIDSYMPYSTSFTMDGPTLTWWMTTASESARKEAFGGNRQPLKSVLENLVSWLSNKYKIKPWSHGSSFDISILSYTFKIFNICCPWKFWDIRDTRTLYEVAGINLKTLAPTVISSQYPEHHAVGDCLRQINGVKKSNDILAELRSRPVKMQKI